MDEDNEDNEDDEDDEEDKEDKEEEGRGRRRKAEGGRQEEVTDIKFNNPHLAGGKKKLYCRLSHLVTLNKAKSLVGHLLLLGGTKSSGSTGSIRICLALPCCIRSWRANNEFLVEPNYPGPTSEPQSIQLQRLIVHLSQGI